MQAVIDGVALPFAQAWIGLGIVLVYYLAMAAVFRRRGWQQTKVTRYEPPPGISPAIAATLRERGRCERAFAAALVSLAGKGFVKILQQDCWIALQKLREADESLPTEEAVIVISLFQGSQDTRILSTVEDEGLCEAFMQFEAAVESVTLPRLISTHLPFWLLGVAGSLVAILPVIGTLLLGPRHDSFTAIAYQSLWVILGGSCLVAALHVWPGTLRRMASSLRWDGRPSRTLNLNDAVPLFLSSTALLGFIFLANMTSTAFALLLTAVLTLNALFRYWLEGLTRSGRKVLAGLECFGKFLAETDSDRLNRENRAGHSPEVIERSSGYALALGAEHAWGEEFVEDITGLLEFDIAYRWRVGKLPDIKIGEGADRGIIQLNISPRK